MTHGFSIIWDGDFKINLLGIQASIVFVYILDVLNFLDIQPKIDERDLTLNRIENTNVKNNECLTKWDYIFFKS